MMRRNSISLVHMYSTERSVSTFAFLPASGGPWCATSVSSTGVMRTWDVCSVDERRIAFDLGAQGQMCNVPFLMNKT